MAKENEFIRKGDIKKEEEVKTEKKEPKAPKKVEKKEGSKNNPLDTLISRLDKKRTKTILGSILVLFSFYFFLACFSYIFTWSADQDRVLNKSLFDFLMETNEEPVSNWFGKMGSWISHLFIYRWFGLSSFIFPFILFIVGFKWMLAIQLFPLKRTVFVSLVLMIWSSIFLGFFASAVNYIGGSFGFHINNWLFFTFGKFGAFLFIILLLYIVLVALFNPDFKALWNKYIARNVSQNDVEEDVEVPADGNSFTDIRIINPINEEEILEEKIVKPVHFDEDEDEDEEEEDLADSDFEITIKPAAKTKPTSTDTDFEIEVPEEEPMVAKKEDGFTIDIPEAEDILSDDETDRLKKEFGEYDPTLDLSGYVLPSIDLLRDWGGNGSVNINKQELEDNKNKIVETLSHYKIDIAKIKATVGPTVTLYEIIPAPGVRISKIKNLEDDIALSLSALGIRIIAPIPGKGTIGIEVPNSNPEMVSMRSLIASEKFQNSDYELPVVMGKTITNETFTFDLTKMPHLLVAGATGQGKSVGLNAILISILYKKHPSQVKFILIDPKKVELTLYNRIERHFLAKLPGEDEAIITDTSKVVNTLNSLCIEMDTSTLR